MTEALGLDAAGEYRQKMDRVLFRAWRVFAWLYAAQWFAICVFETPPFPTVIASVIIATAQVRVSAAAARAGALTRGALLRLAGVVGVGVVAMLTIAAVWPESTPATTDGLLLLTCPTLAGCSAFLGIAALTASLTFVVAVATVLTALTHQSVAVEQALSTGFAGLTVVFLAVGVLQRAAEKSDEVAASNRADIAEQAEAAELVSAEARAISLIHETVLGTLFAASLQPETPSPRLPTFAQHAYDALMRPFDSTSEPVPLGTILAADVHSWPVPIEVHLKSIGTELVPSGVAAAAVSAVRAALDNVARHSGAREAFVEVFAYPHDLVVTVRDEGIGFTTDSVDAGQGLKNTLTRRIHLTGGHTEITSLPLAGTTIRLSWPSEALAFQPRQPQAVPLNWLSELNLTTSRVWSTYMAPQFVAICAFAILHSDLTASHCLLGVVLALQILLSIGAARLLSRGSESTLGAIALAGATVIPLVVGIRASGPNTDGFAFWPVEGASFPLGALAFLHSPKRSVPVVSIAVAATAALLPQTSPGARIGATAAIMIAPAVTFMHRRASRRVSQALARGLAEVEDLAIRERELEAQLAVERHRLSDLQLIVAPYLRRVASGSWSPRDREEARRLHLIARWHLDIPSLMDRTTSDALAALLASGCEVQIHGSAVSEPAVELARRVLALVATSTPPSEFSLGFAKTAHGSSFRVLIRGDDSTLRDLMVATRGFETITVTRRSRRSPLIVEYEPASVAHCSGG